VHHCHLDIWGSPKGLVYPALWASTCKFYYGILAFYGGLEGLCLPKLYIMCCFISRSFPYDFLTMLNLWLYSAFFSVHKILHKMPKNKNEKEIFSHIFKSDNCEHIVSARFMNSFCCHHLQSLVWICGLLHVRVSLKLRICLSFYGANDAKIPQQQHFFLEHMHASQK
jgi:hypothetical protein